LQERSGRYTQALRWYGRAAAEADDAERVELTVARAVARQRQGRYVDSIALCREAVVAAEQLGDRASLAYAYFLLHAAHTDLGTGEAGDYAAKALVLYEELGDLIGQANVQESLGIEAYWEGSWDESYALYERSGDLRDRAGHIVYARFASNNMAEILSDRGQWAEADALFTEARRVWRAARYPFGVALANGNLGRSAARAGHYDDARLLLEVALEQWTQLGSTAFRLETEARLAELDVFEGRFESAIAGTDSAFAEIDTGSGSAMLRAFLHRSLGCAWMQSGEPQRACDVLRASVNEAREAAAPYEEALSLDALATVLDASAGDGWVERAAAQEVFDRLGVQRVASIPIPSTA
jgi:tetratricopeptide (TPR) repeat protein